MYNQQFQSRNQNSQRSYQPVGQVPSFYGQNQQQPSFNRQSTQQSFHSAQYRGNQAGHDVAGRADSFSPAQQSGFQSTWAGSSSVQPSVSSSAQSFHSSNYQGNQFGHDAAGRSDSFSPSQYGNQFGSQYNTQLNNQIGAANQASNQFGFSQSHYPIQNSGFSGNQSSWGSGNSTQSFHTANYQGNQPGHDAAQRGDSFTSSQQGYGRTAASFTNNQANQQQSGFNNAY